jgi:uncharacterized protein (TIGR02246 family)
MNSGTGETPQTEADNEKVIRAFPLQMIDAWNRGSAEGFAAPFTEDADFVAFEGTHLKGRRQITAFHQQIFDTVVKGSRLEGEVKFVRFLTSELAVMHAVARVTLPGRTVPSPGRDSMQLFVAALRDGQWRLEAVLNARKLTLEQQYFSDEFDALPANNQQQVRDFVRSLQAPRR